MLKNIKSSFCLGSFSDKKSMIQHNWENIRPLKEVYGPLWKYTVLYESMRFHMEANGPLWKYMVIYESIRSLIGVYGPLWK